MSGLRDVHAQFADQDAQVLGVSMDNLETQTKFAESLTLPFPLLADPEGVAAKAYGVANPAGYANRVTFVIGKDGKVAKVIEGKDAIDPSAAELARGLDEVEKATTPGPPTARERDYVAAVRAFYAGADHLDHRARSVAFAGAMEQVHARYPADQEAAIFYGLALLGTASPADKTYTVQKKAADVLNAVLPSAPDHPGIAHYVIHSFDYPPLAELALPAARAYARIAPSAPHALHMPSHIFTRLGLWDESIAGNLASAEAARRVVARLHPGATSFDELHALDYLEDAYLQEGRDAEADGGRQQIGRVGTLDSPNFAAAYALAAVPARHALERRDWATAAALTLAPSSFPWAQFPHTEAIGVFTRAVGAARQSDPPAPPIAAPRPPGIDDRP